MKETVQPCQKRDQSFGDSATAPPQRDSAGTCPLRARAGKDTATRKKNQPFHSFKRAGQKRAAKRWAARVRRRQRAKRRRHKTRRFPHLFRDDLDRYFLRLLKGSTTAGFLINFSNLKTAMREKKTSVEKNSLSFLLFLFPV